MEITSIFLDKREIKVAIPNPITASRVLGFWHKEPDTIEWIQSFKQGELLFDIGANIGLYSLYAGARGVNVVSFEPEAQNFALLNRNIFLNQLGHLISAYPIALSNEIAFSHLHLSHFIEGGSCHNFKEKIDYKQEPSNPQFSQGSFSFPLDELIQKNHLKIPTHIKIDVDGIEHKIVQGALKTLGNTLVRSVLIELNTNLNSHLEVIEIMLKNGFNYSKNLSDAYRCDSGPFNGIGNFIFYRTDKQ